MTTIEALETILEEGQSDETGGQYGLDELDEIAIRATEPVDDPEGFVDFWEEVKAAKKLVVNQSVDVVTGTFVGVKIGRIG